jgi:arylsulfatase A
VTTSRIGRRLPLCMLAACLAGCGSAPTSGEPSLPRRVRPPNIVVLYADDLGYGDLGCYSADSKIPTPSLDRLAAEGLRCTDAHSSSGVCTPSRYALLTGRHHWRDFHEIVDSFGPPVFAEGRLTMAAMLRQHGYRTACIGKWHLGWDWAALRNPGAVPDTRKGYAPDAFDWSKPIPGGPLARGFDHYFGDDVPNFPPYTWIEDDRVVVAPTASMVPQPQPREGSPECRPGPMADGWRLDAVMPELTRRALRWIEAQQASEQPFFLYFPFTAPHAPIVPAPEFVGRSAAGPYGDFVVQCDAVVGAVLHALEAGGFADDTIVIFSSDNGPEAYAYERMRQFEHSSPGGLRGLKRDVWEGGHRVPLIVRWPGVIAAGRTSAALVGQVDLMATLAAAVGCALPADAAEDSFDQLPVWRGDRESVREFLVHNTYAKKWGVRRGDWLLLAQPDGYHNRTPQWALDRYPANAQGVFLCDLSRDLGQREDVSARHPEVVADLQQLLADLRQRGHSAPRLSAPEVKR